MTKSCKILFITFCFSLYTSDSFSQAQAQAQAQINAEQAQQAQETPSKSKAQAKTIASVNTQSKPKTAQKRNFRSAAVLEPTTPKPILNVPEGELPIIPFMGDIVRLQDQFMKFGNTQALTIVHKGFRVFDYWPEKKGGAEKYLGWSMAKSVASILMGTLEYKKVINRKDNIRKFFDRPIDQEKFPADLNFEHLLTHSSGLNWNEGYEKNPLRSSVLSMLFGSGSLDVLQFIMNQGFSKQPGTHFEYSSGSTNLMMAALKKAYTLNSPEYGDTKYRILPWEELFFKIKSPGITVERDSKEIFLLSSFIYASIQDYAKLGLLMLNNGVFENERYLSDDWIKFSTTISDAYKNTVKPSDEKEGHMTQAAHWLVNKYAHKEGSPIPEAPIDMYAAAGHWGQYIFVIPSWDMVIVRLGDDRNEQFKMNEFFKWMKEIFVYESAKN